MRHKKWKIFINFPAKLDGFLGFQINGRRTRISEQAHKGTREHVEAGSLCDRVNHSSAGPLEFPTSALRTKEPAQGRPATVGNPCTPGLCFSAQAFTGILAALGITKFAQRRPFRDWRLQFPGPLHPSGQVIHYRKMTALGAKKFAQSRSSEASGSTAQGLRTEPELRKTFGRPYLALLKSSEF